MADSQWKSTFAELAPLHEGLPDWFSTVIKHVLRFRQGRDRFNLYNTCRALATASDTSLKTPQLRNTLERFAGQGVRFAGSHSQKVILDKRLILFWSRFLIPACETSPHDLSVFRAALQAWRFDDLAANPIIKQLLLPSYRSFTKEHVTKHCLQALFSDPRQYKQFVDWQVTQLSPTCVDLYKALCRGPQLTQDIICNNNEWLAAYELWNALLVHPTYETRDGRILLQLGTFKGFKTPFRLSPVTTKPTISHEPYLEPIRFATSQLLNGHTVPFSVLNYKRTFLYRQLDIFKEEAGDFIDEIQGFLKWWHDTIGPGFIQRKTLPASDCGLTCSISGRYVPIIIENRYNFDSILEISLKFGLLTTDDENHLALTHLGRIFVGDAKPNLAVKTIWARNVNRLSLRLGDCWSEGFRRFLDLLATPCGNSEYEVTPASLAKSGLSANLAAVIIGGFTQLDVRQMERLSSWQMITEVKELHHKTFPARRAQCEKVDQEDAN